MNADTFNILIVIVALCIAAAAYAKGKVDGWNDGFAACSEIWNGEDGEDILDEEEIS